MSNDPKGSVWRLWDLHFHTPSSYDVKHNVKNEQIIDLLIEREIAAVAITDHHFIDVERIREIQKLAGDRIVIFPGIELRSELGGSESVHFVGIFPEINSGIDIEQIWKTLEVKLEISNKVKKFGDDAVFFDLKDSADEIHRLEGLVSVHAGGKSNTIENIRNTKEYKKAIKRDLVENAIDFFEAGDKQDVEDYNKKVFPNIGKELPIVVTSDTHHRSSDTQRESCWIRADVTFAGLKRILDEPGRVFVGETPLLIERVKGNPSKFIEKVGVHKKENADLKEKWFDFDLDINSGLVAIIGNKGGGKSALSDTIGLLGKTLNAGDFSFLNERKFKHSRNNKAQYFQASMKWMSGETDICCLADIVELGAIEKVKYIPQNYLEKICNEIVIGKGSSFDTELKSVIFSHVSSEERLGFRKFDDLLDFNTEEITHRIDMHRNKLHGLNDKIVKIETLLHPSHKQQLKNKLKQKKVELENHTKSKPKEVQNPHKASPGGKQSVEQKEMGNKKKLIKNLKAQFFEIKEMRANETKRHALSNKLLDKLDNFRHIYNDFIAKLVECEALEINQEEIVTLSIKKEKVEKIRDESEELIAQFDIYLDKDIDGSIAKIGVKLQKEIKSLQNKMDIPNQKYQNYIKALESWGQRTKEIVGDSGTTDTIKFYDNELEKIKEYPDRLDELRIEQKKMVKTIYDQLVGLAETYRILYEPVENFILQHELAPKLELSFEVNITPIDFAKEFFNMVNQGRRGSFCGTEEGRNFLRTILLESDLDSIEGVLQFLKKIENALRTDIREDPPIQMEIKEQLRKGYEPLQIYDFLFGLSYLYPKYSLKWGGKELSLLSPGERGTLLLIFYLLIDQDSIPLVIDQPEENLDNETVYRVLVPCIKELKNRRQIIIVTHNPNLAVVCDADQIIYASIDKTAGNNVTYTSGAIENLILNNHILNVLEGTRPAFDNRDSKYNIVV